MMRYAIALLALLLVPTSGLAQSTPNFSRGQVPTAGQWNAAFASKQDRLTFSPLNQNGGTMQGKFQTAPSTTNGAGLSILPGTAPGAPSNGDLWATTGGFFGQINGQTIQFPSVAQVNARQPIDPTLTALSGVGAPALRTTGAGYQVQPDKTIQGPDGKRFIVRGVTLFDGLFVSYETRSDYRYRAVSGQAPTSGGSTQTGYEASQWGSPATMQARLSTWAALGTNLLRVAVEPAIIYTAAANGYPSHLDMLDQIIDAANRLGMVVQIQNGNDAAPTALNVAFMGQLRDRYWTRKNVWINPANEMNCSTGGSDCTNPSVWAAEMRQYVQALRADVTGQSAGTKFLGPVVINATNYGYAVNAVAATLTSDAVFTSDPNLILGVHVYQNSETTFAARLSDIQTAAATYIGTFPILIDETGLSNTASVRDPSLDPGASSTTYPVSDQATLTSHYNWVQDLSAWARKMSRETAFSGVTWFAGSWYVPGLGVHEANSLMRRDGTLTPVGQYVRDGWLAPPPDQTSFSGKGLTNWLVNGDMALNTRAFAGGAAASGVGLWDGWFSADGSTSVTRASDGTVTLSAGFIKQTIRDLPNLPNAPVVVSFDDLVGYVNVYLGPPGNPGQFAKALGPTRGRGRGASVVLPPDFAGTDLVLTIQASGGAASWKNAVLERGYTPTQPERRSAQIARVDTRSYVQRIGDPAGTYLDAGQLVAVAANTLTFSVPYPGGPLRAAPSSTAFVGTANTDYGVTSNGAVQSGFTFAVQNAGSGKLQVVATKTSHGLTAASLAGFFTAAGGIIVSAE